MRKYIGVQMNVFKEENEKKVIIKNQVTPQTTEIAR